MSCSFACYSACDSFIYYPVKARLPESQPEAEEQTNHNVQFQALWLVGTSTS